MSLIGIELGEVEARAVVVDPESGTVRARAAVPVTSADTASAALAALRDVRTAGGDASAIGVARAFQSDALAAELTEALQKAAGPAPVDINSGHAAALAEAWCGAARGATNVVSFAIADHVTSGIMIDGRVLSGAHGCAGSVAWLTLNPVEREDYRRRGGLEAEISAGGIVRRLVWRIKSGDASSVVDRVAGDLSRLTAADVFAAARAGDGVCESVIRDTAKYVGMAVANLVAVVDPECVVLGGTLATSGDLMLDPIRTECSRRLRSAQSERVRIELSTLGGDAPAVGAARAAQLQRQ